MKMFGFDTLDWRQVKIDWDAITDDIIKAGTPMDKDGHICNDGNVFGILMDDVQRKRNVQGRVVISGCMDMKAAEEHSGITLSAEAKAALPDVWTQSGGDGVTDYNKLENKPVGVEMVEILPETTVKYEPGSDYAEIAATVLLTEGQAYTLKWNGVDYECVCSVQGDGIYVLGNASMSEGGDTGEPFIFASIPQDGVCQVMPIDGSTSITLSITDKIVKKLDMKFLPEGYPYKETGMTVILPEMTVDGGEEVPVMTEIELVEGKTYTVKWNGTEYTCVAQKWEKEGATAGVVVGDYGLVTADGPITGDPFLIADLSAEVSTQLGGVPTLLMCIDGSTSVTLSITAKAEVVHKMAGEYLPDGMPYAEPFDEVIFDAWPEGAWAGWTYYVTTPVNPLTPGYVYKVNWNGVIYECVARAIAVDGSSVCLLGNGGFGVLGSLDTDYKTNEPFEIVIYNTPVVSSDGETLVYGGMSSVDATAATEFSVTGAYKAQQISEHCLPEIKAPLIVTFTNSGDTWEADTFINFAKQELKKGRLVMARYTEKTNYQCFLNLTKVDVGVLVFSGCFVEDNNVIIKQISWEGRETGRGTLSTYTLTATAE